MTATWPRVSTILKIVDDAYGTVPEHALAVAAARGERLHRLCLSYLASLDGLCEKPAEIQSEDAAAYLSFVQWAEAQKVTPIAIEEPSVCTEHQYRGTPDALVSLGPRQIPTLIDLKFTAAIQRTNRVQVQAYKKMDLYSEAKEVCLLHIIPACGKLKHEVVKSDPRDFAVFLNALSIWRWRQS